MKLRSNIRRLQVRQVDEDDAALEETIAIISYEDFEPEAVLNGNGGSGGDLEDTEAELEIIEEGGTSDD